MISPLSSSPLNLTCVFLVFSNIMFSTNCSSQTGIAGIDCSCHVIPGSIGLTVMLCQGCGCISNDDESDNNRHFIVPYNLQRHSAPFYMCS